MVKESRPDAVGRAVGSSECHDRTEILPVLTVSEMHAMCFGIALQASTERNIFLECDRIDATCLHSFKCSMDHAEPKHLPGRVAVRMTLPYVCHQLGIASCIYVQREVCGEFARLGVVCVHFRHMSPRQPDKRRVAVEDSEYLSGELRIIVSGICVGVQNDAVTPCSPVTECCFVQTNASSQPDVVIWEAAPGRTQVDDVHWHHATFERIATRIIGQFENRLVAFVCLPPLEGAVIRFIVDDNDDFDGARLDKLPRQATQECVESFDALVVTGTITVSCVLGSSGDSMDALYPVTGSISRMTFSILLMGNVLVHIGPWYYIITFYFKKAISSIPLPCDSNLNRGVIKYDYKHKHSKYGKNSPDRATSSNYY